jgi:fatty acid desaturase
MHVSATEPRQLLVHARAPASRRRQAGARLLRVLAVVARLYLGAALILAFVVAAAAGVVAYALAWLYQAVAHPFIAPGPRPRRLQ